MRVNDRVWVIWEQHKLCEGCVHFWCLFEVVKWQKDFTTVFILVRTLYHEKKNHHKPNVTVLLVTEECCELCKGIEYVSLHISGSWLHQANAVVCAVFSASSSKADVPFNRV